MKKCLPSKCPIASAHHRATANFMAVDSIRGVTVGKDAVSH